MDQNDLKRALMGAIGRAAGDSGMVAIEMGGGNQEWNVTVDPAAQIMMLREQYEAYANPQFKPGDVVTPKGFCGHKGAGQPHIVVETNYGVERVPIEAKGGTSAADGRVLNIRVMTYVQNDLITCFWNEAWEYEYYDDRKHGGK